MCWRSVPWRWRMTGRTCVGLGPRTTSSLCGVGRRNSLSYWQRFDNKTLCDVKIRKLVICEIHESVKGRRNVNYMNKREHPCPGRRGNLVSNWLPIWENGSKLDPFRGGKLYPFLDRLYAFWHDFCHIAQKSLDYIWKKFPLLAIFRRILYPKRVTRVTSPLSITPRITPTFLLVFGRICVPTWSPSAPPPPMINVQQHMS
jgi:hypothetical protein